MKFKSIKFWGYVAGILTTSSFLPQLLKTLESRETKDISLWMYIVLSTGVFLWVVHGIKNKDGPVILFNAVTLILALIILSLKWVYG